MTARNEQGSVLDDERGSVLDDERGSVLDDERGSVLDDERGSVLDDERGSVLGDERGSVLDDERGSVAIEVVLMVPVLVLFTLLVIAGGRFVSVEADVEAAARDAARAASFERSFDAARVSARATVADQLDDFWDCRTANVTGDFRSGGIVEVEVHCNVPVDDLGLIGLGGTVPVSVTGSAPLDTYRRTQ